MKIEDLSLFLTKVSLFKGLNPDKIAKCLTEADFKIKEYKKNEIVFFRGDILKKIIIIVKGTARGEMQKFNGDTITIDYITPYQLIAPAFIFGSNRTFPVDLISTENSKFLFLNKDNFLNAMQKDERLLVNFLDEISNKGQLLSKRIWFNFMNKTINEKVLSYIKENQKNGYISFKPNISELAKKFEVTRPSLSREISSLCDKGILTKIRSGKYKLNCENL